MDLTHYHVRDSLGVASFRSWQSAQDYADWCMKYLDRPRPAVIECEERECLVTSAQWKQAS